MRYRLTIAFLGTPFHGWQEQANAVTVQGVLNRALTVLFGEKIAAVGCSRTDAGVHAEEFVCHFDAEKLFPAERLPFALAPLLPDSIAVLKGERAPDGFHARFDTKSKIYRYDLFSSECRDPFLEGRAARIGRKIDFERLSSEINGFSGTHDFASFMAAGSDVKGTVRTIYSVKAEKRGDRISLTFHGNGFLYHMVRIMVGTLLERNFGKELLSIPEILEKKDRSFAGVTAKPEGLYLQNVFYE